METSLLRGVLALQAGVAIDYPTKPTLIRDNPTYRLYQAGDGAWFFLAVGNQTFWVKLCKALELEHLADDPRFGSWLARLENNQALLPLIDAKFKSQSRDHWLELLAKHDIPAAPVQTVMEFMQHPAVRHHDMVREYEHPEVGRLRLMGQPHRLHRNAHARPGPAADARRAHGRGPARDRLHRRGDRRARRAGGVPPGRAGLRRHDRWRTRRSATSWPTASRRSRSTVPTCTTP